jgi:hypothetical protein
MRFKSFTGFDISGKMKQVFEAAEAWELTWIKPWEKEN